MHVWCIENKIHIHLNFYFWTILRMYTSTWTEWTFNLHGYHWIWGWRICLQSSPQNCLLIWKNTLTLDTHIFCLYYACTVCVYIVLCTCKHSYMHACRRCIICMCVYMNVCMQVGLHTCIWMDGWLYVYYVQMYASEITRFWGRYAIEMTQNHNRWSTKPDVGVSPWEGLVKDIVR